MKIGIMTFHWAQNYGAVLQCYALKCKLEEMGHDVWVIDRLPQYSGIVCRLYHRFSYKHYFSWMKFDRFNRSFLIPKTRKYRSMKELEKHFGKEGFDCVIVGSDQVWRWNIMGYNYFLDFVDVRKTSKVSYASSFGLSHWEENGLDRLKIAELLKEFSHVSVRERTGVEICKHTFGIHAELVIDPTMLHDASFYENTLLKDYPKISGTKVVSCILGKENRGHCLQLSNWAWKRSLAYEELYWTSWDFFHMEFCRGSFLHISVPEWLNEIRNAAYVVTNSFHCAVFAILFHKQFVVLNNHSGGGDRIRTLLTALHLEDRFSSSLDERILSQLLHEPIPYEKVEKRLCVLRESSLAFLKNL